MCGRPDVASGETLNPFAAPAALVHCCSALLCCYACLYFSYIDKTYQKIYVSLLIVLDGRKNTGL